MTNWNMRTEELELKDGSTIKNYHYEFNSTDRVLAKIVEDVFKGIMDIKADRKTEPQTCIYKSNWKLPNCEDEPQTETSTNSEKLQLTCNDCDQQRCETCVTEIGKDETKTEHGIGCSRCEGRYDCYDRDMPHAVHCNNYGKITDEPQTEEYEEPNYYDPALWE